MSFVLSKFVWGLLAPGTLLFLAITGSLLLQSKAPRMARALLVLGVAFLALLLLTPIGNRALDPLEQRFPRADVETKTVDGIIVLGGVIDPKASHQYGTIVLSNSAERLTESVALAKRFPKAKMIFTSGSGSLRNDEREADVAALFYQQQGLDISPITFERDSRNTYENAIESKKLMRPQPGERWLLVTSAFHMPRSVGCFRAIGWDVTAYPVDFRAETENEWLHFNASEQLSLLSTAVREYIGLLSYRLMGRSPELLPAP